MKKKILILLGISCLIVPFFAIKDNAKADEGNIKSTGNFVFGQDEAAIYASDIMYLQREITKLFNEIE